MSVTPSAPPDATTTERGLMSAADKTKLDAQSGTNTGDVTVTSPAGWLSSVGQALTFALVSAGAAVAGVVDTAAQTFAGVKTFTSAIIASAGIQLSALWNTNGTGASDVGVKVGVSTADASVNANATLLWVGTSIGSGAEVRRVYVNKTSLNLVGHLSGNRFGLEERTGGASTQMAFQVATLTPLVFDLSSGAIWFHYNTRWFNAAGSVEVARVDNNGQLLQYGTDSSGTPGAAIINKPTGKSAIAASSTTVVITNSLVTANSRITITPMENSTNNAEFRQFKVTPAAGNFTVTLNSAVTVAWPFAWDVATIL